MLALTSPSDHPEDLILLFITHFFFFTLKYLVIHPGAKELLVEQEKKFLEDKARVSASVVPLVKQSMVL